MESPSIHICCGKFDNFISIKNTSRKRLRIGSVNPNTLINNNYIPISTNGEVVFYNNKIFSARDFFETIDKQLLKNLIVLTVNEREKLLDILVDFDIDIHIFEIKYPIYKHIRYISNIHLMYKELKKLLIDIKNLQLVGNSLAHQVSTTYLYKIERKLRFKNSLDKYFAFAYKNGYQEVFKLKENRSDRVVIAMDFNSMYIDCMMGKFLEPKSINYKNYRNIDIKINMLKNGLYRVFLKNPKNTFFKDFHPFKYVHLNKSNYFKLESHQIIEIMLFKNEIEYYKKIFENIEIIEGFYSEKNIEHPLKKDAQEIYEHRLKTKGNNNTLANLLKFKLITMHSSTNPKRFKILQFKTLESIVRYLSNNYMINFPNNMTNFEKLKSISDKKNFSFWKSTNIYKVKIVNLDTYDSIFSLSAQIVANSRLKIMQTIESFLKYNSVEICYSNIDSLHISILKDEVTGFFNAYKNIFSNKMGDLKIESISNQGYWLDIGKYWLISDEKVDLFKNILFNNHNSHVVRSKQLKSIVKNSSFSYIKVRWISIYDSLSYNKKVEIVNIDNFNFKRYNFAEIQNLNVANITKSKEVLRSKQIKTRIIRGLLPHK